MTIPKVVIAQEHDALLRDVADYEGAEGEAAFWWMGQHTFIVKAGGTVFYIDPWFPDWESRQTRPLLTPQEARLANFVLVTHGHADHLCPETLPHVVTASPSAKFICPRTEADRLKDECSVPEDRLYPLSAGEALEMEGVRITAIKSRHEFFDEHPTLGFPYLGYVVEAGGVTFYHSGDTIPYEGLATTLSQWPRLDAMFLPINGRDAERFLRNCAGNLTFQEAAELAGDLKTGLAVAAHWDMFIGNQEDPARFVDLMRAKYPETHYWVGAAGERVIFRSR